MLSSLQILQPNARGKHQQGNNSCADGHDTISKTGEKNSGRIKRVCLKHEMTKTGKSQCGIQVSVRVKPYNNYYWELTTVESVPFGLTVVSFHHFTFLCFKHARIKKKQKTKKQTINVKIIQTPTNMLRLAHTELYPRLFDLKLSAITSQLW